MSGSGCTRRRFLKMAAASSTAAMLPAMAGASVGRGFSHLRTGKETAGGIKLGVATYSLRSFSRKEAIEMVRALRTPYVNVKSFHLPYDSTPEELQAGRREFEAAGLKVVGGGNNTIREDTDAHVEKFFKYGKLCGMPLLVIAPTPANLPRIEKFVKKYDIAVAIHNHGPEDKYFPAPSDALPLIKNMDARVGLCVDVGHTARTGADVVEEIARAGRRVLDMHMKDLADLRKKESQCIVGRGAMPVAAIFRQLQKMRYAGYVNLEYEIHKNNPLPGMLESFAYMRGVLAGLWG